MGSKELDFCTFHLSYTTFEKEIILSHRHLIYTFTMFTVPRFFEIEHEFVEVYNNVTGLNITETKLTTTTLRNSANYIKYYYVSTHFFVSALIPFVMLIFLNICIIRQIYKTSKAVQR